MLQRLSVVLESIKFAHSIFALPFALLAMIVAAGGLPPPLAIALIVVCMVSARSAAMAFNRLADREIDAINPRTKSRPSVTGAVSPGFLLVFVFSCAAIFVAAAGCLNAACLALSLPVLGILLGYSYSKRFTPLCHFWLGLSLGLAPLGAHLAVRGDLSPLPGLAQRWNLSWEIFPVLLGAMVLCWVAGFDLIYACQDYEVDSGDARVRSLPKSIGIAGTLHVSSLLHCCAVALLVACGVYAGMGAWYFVSVALTGALLVYEHCIVSPTDLARVNVAFFTVNGAVSLLLFGAVLFERVILPALRR